VQSVIPLPDGSGLRLTTARYFTPSGVCINGIGITPDVVVEDKNSSDDDSSDQKVVNKDNNDDVDTIFSNLEDKNTKDKDLSPEEKKQELLKKKDQDDLQLQSAINVIKGIKIYRNFQR